MYYYALGEPNIILYLGGANHGEESVAAAATYQSENNKQPRIRQRTKDDSAAELRVIINTILCTLVTPVRRLIILFLNKERKCNCFLR